MRILLIFAIVIFAITVDAHKLAKRSYVPQPFDYVLPKSWSNTVIPYPDQAQGTGYPAPYASYLSWVNRRCQVLNLTTINGQLYANLQHPLTGYIVLWPVNYVSPFGQVQDYLVKTN